MSRSRRLPACRTGLHGAHRTNSRRTAPWRCSVWQVSTPRRTPRCNRRNRTAGLCSLVHRRTGHPPCTGYCLNRSRRSCPGSCRIRIGPCIVGFSGASSCRQPRYHRGHDAAVLRAATAPGMRSGTKSPRETRGTSRRRETVRPSARTRSAKAREPMGVGSSNAAR